jgi:hypothetical protein
MGVGAVDGDGAGVCGGYGFFGDADEYDDEGVVGDEV